MNDLMLLEPQRAVTNLYVEPTAWQKRHMKAVPEATLKQVLENRPLPCVPRDSGSYDSVNFDSVTEKLLIQMCSDIPYIDEMSGVQSQEEAISFLNRIVDEHRELGMNSQAERIGAELERFTNIRFGLPKVLRFMGKEQLLRPDTIVPMSYLPDIFYAAPVWYFNVTDVRTGAGNRSPRKTEDRDEEIQKLFCNLIPTQRWANSFLLHNRTVRNLAAYKGDMIPSRVLARIKEATPIFDYIVIMTPYHDVVSKEWQDENWSRPPDPYVVGFKKGVPAFFVLARFSESGVFPLFNELVADSIEFLRAKADSLKTSLQRHGSLYWFDVVEQRSTWTDRNKITDHVEDLLKAFDQGILFPWIRSEKELAPKT